MPNHHPLPGDDVVVDGVRLHVVRYGPSTPGRPPLLLLHGLGTSSYLWRDVMRAVGHDTSTIAPDLIGLGRSEFDANRVDLPEPGARRLAPARRVGHRSRGGRGS